MTINSKHLSILKNLIEAGYTDEKQFASFGLGDAVKLPRCCRIDLVEVVDCVNAVKSNRRLSYLVERSDEEKRNEN